MFALATQMGTALSAVTPALRVYPYGTAKIEATNGAAIVTLPDSYEPAGYAGVRSIKGIGVLLCVRDVAAGRPKRASIKALYGYLAETGTASIVKAVEGFAYTACVPGTMAWKKTSFDVLRFGAADYLSALLEFDAEGVST